jgi:uncharacterized protein (TIRG00374 family)
LGLGWAGTHLDWILIGQHLKSASLPLVVAMAVAWTTGLLIRPLRMLILIRAMLPVPWTAYWNVWSADVIALVANSIAPMRAGDALIPFMLRGELGTRAAHLFPIVLVDRFFDFATVVVIFVSALAMVPTVVPWADSATIALLAGLVMLVSGLWFTIHKRSVWVSLLDRMSRRSSEDSEDGLVRKIHDLIGGFAIVDSLRVVAPAMILSLLLWCMTAFAYWLGAIAIYPQTSLVAAAFAAATVALSFIVPLTPGGIGVFHAAMVLALSLFGVPTEMGLAIAIVIHAVLMAAAFAVALVALAVQRISLRSLALLRDGRT